ncbi:MAG: hypothetical protein ABR587_14205 [Candidatus Binatia bacterium]
MPIAELAQQTVLDQPSRIALRLPLGETLGALHPAGCFPLVEDPRAGERALIFGMMVLRPADAAWNPVSPASDFAGAVSTVRDWCFDVDGIGGSWPISAGNTLDAYRLALQYGTVDAVMAGAVTVAREGLLKGARPGHLWQPYAPLSWPALRPHRDVLEAAIAELRRDWQQLGVVSARRYPAQIAITATGLMPEGSPDLLDARIFHDRHPDGSAIEALLLTSESGAARLRERARTKGMRIDDMLIVASAPGRPDEIDVAGVPNLLRSRLDARLVEHDGGAMSLEGFAKAGALAQVNLTLMRGRSVRDVLAASSRIEPAVRDEVLQSWVQRRRLFPLGDGKLPPSWRPVYALVEDTPAAEAVVVSFDVR